MRAHDDRHEDGFGPAERDRPEAPRRGVFARLFGLVKLAVLLTPLSIFAYGYFVADCRTRGSGAFGQFFEAGVCARNEIVGSAFALQDNLKLIRRIID